MRSFSRGFDQVMSWDLAYARTNGTTYTLKTGFDYEAVEEKDMSDYADKIIAEANCAKKAGVDFYMYSIRTGWMRKARRFHGEQTHMKTIMQIRY